MSTLHLVRRSGFESTDFTQCIENLLPNDNVVLLDDGCYNINHCSMEQVPAKVQVCMINDHAVARALTAPAQVKMITMKEMVALTFNNQRVITWQ